MIGGLFKSASRLALVAVAGVMVGGVSAQAADLGGDCCADLEERVAELEATTVRKGTRKVSVTLSGWVNESIWFWDDGREKNTYVTNNNHQTSRFRFTGEAKITPKWTAGYYLEFGVIGQTSSDGANQFQDDNQNNNTGLQLRQNNWYLDHKDYGRVTVGRTTDASTGAQSVTLANTQVGDGFGLNNIGGGMRLRGGAGVSAEGIGSMSGLKWGDLRGPLFSNGNIGSGEKFVGVKYTSPVMMGFIFQAFWGEDDRWDAALRYAGEFSGFKLAAAAGYGNWTDGNVKPGTATGTAAGVYGDGSGGDFGCAVNTGKATATNLNSDVDCSNYGGSASVMHAATGLFVSGGYGAVQDKMITAGNLGIAGYNPGDTHSMWWVQAGIEQKWFSIGKTTLYGTYMEAAMGQLIDKGGAKKLGDTDTLNPGTFGAGLSNISAVDTQSFTIGVNQSIEAAAMDLYLYYRNDSADINLRSATTGDAAKAISPNDIQMIVMGAMIKF